MNVGEERATIESQSPKPSHVFFSNSNNFHLLIISEVD